jgi:hypothetical protein
MKNWTMHNGDHEIPNNIVHNNDHLNATAWANQSQSYFFSDPFGGYYIVHQAIYESPNSANLLLLFFILFYSIL